jgi:outer membrane protein TolC
MAIPIELDSPAQAALAACGGTGPVAPAPGQSATTRRWRAEVEAARLQAVRARSMVRPDLELSGQLATNGIDRDARGPTAREAFAGDHLAWTVAASLSVPLARYAERAAELDARARLDRAEAQAAQAADDLRAQWLDACADVRRLARSRDLLARAHDQQDRRLALEERRFAIGRATTRAVIQAGDDATAARFALSEVESGLRQAAWVVRRLRGALQEERP